MRIPIIKLRIWLLVVMLASLRDKYIKRKGCTSKGKEKAYSDTGLYYKDANEDGIMNNISS